MLAPPTEGEKRLFAQYDKKKSAPSCFRDKFRIYTDISKEI